MARQTPLKGVALCRFAAVAMPARRQPPARVGRRLGIQREGGGWGGRWLFRIAPAEAPPVCVGSGGKEGRAAGRDAKLRSNSLARSCCEAALNSLPRPSGTTRRRHKLSIHWQ